MKKYSYHIVGLIGNKPEIGGTGFFIKKELKYYFVSAWHCFSFKNYISKIHENPNAYLIRDVIIYRNLSDVKLGSYIKMPLFDPSTNQQTFFSIFHDEKLLDITAKEIEKDLSFNFDYIVIDEDHNQKMPTVGDKAFYYGFPIQFGRQSDSPSYYEGTISEISENIKEYTVKICGSIGCSGAPLFIEIDNVSILKAVLFYALKDSTGKADLCKAIDLCYLLNKL